MEQQPLLALILKLGEYVDAVVIDSMGADLVAKPV
jgi:hypothetical protein